MCSASQAAASNPGRLRPASTSSLGASRVARSPGAAAQNLDGRTTWGAGRRCLMGKLTPAWWIAANFSLPTTFPGGTERQPIRRVTGCLEDGRPFARVAAE